MENIKPRIHYWDNIKGFLILLVVLGHLLEQIPDGRTSVIYKLIYLFHMPLFVFCSGYLANYSPQKIVKRLLIPYVILQILCCICTFQKVQITTPFWILWYLLALAVWRITIPFLDKCSKKRVPIAIVLLVLCGCLFGLDDTVGYYGTLSRIIVFYPFFVAGYYIKKYGYFQQFQSVPKTIKAISVLTVLVAVVTFSFFASHIDAKWLYGSYSYAAGNHNAFFRAAHYLLATMIGAVILIFAPKEKTFLSAWGNRSFIIYLSHMAIVPVVRVLISLIEMNRSLQYAVCFIISVVFCIVTARVKERITRIYQLYKHEMNS